jgi:hypothetical protein
MHYCVSDNGGQYGQRAAQMADRAMPERLLADLCSSRQQAARGSSHRVATPCHAMLCMLPGTALPACCFTTGGILHTV